MGTCPQCSGTVQAEAWFCPVCGHQLASEQDILEGAVQDDSFDALDHITLDPNADLDGQFDDVTAQDPTDDPGAAPFATQFGTMTLAEISRTVAWERAPETFLQSEALILGELSEQSSADTGAETFEGVVGTGDGTESYLIYTDGASTRAALSPNTVARRTDSPAAGLTPYEDFLLSRIDGETKLEDISESGVLAPYEINVSMLTLLDRGLIEVGEDAPLTQEVSTGDVEREVSESLSIAIDEAPMVEQAAPERAGELRGLPASELAKKLREDGEDLRPNARALGEAGPARSSVVPPKAGQISRSADVKHPRIAPLRAHRNKSESTEAKLAQVERDSRMMVKAEQLYEAAIRDHSDGNLVSARMNLKLALALSPEDDRFQQLFAQLTQTKVPQKNRATLKHPQAQMLYEQATKAEGSGDIDRAVELLDRALRLSKEAVLYNRLGVILATKKKDFVRAHDLLQTATELDPKNPAYFHNLSKVLALHATNDAKAARAGSSKAGKPGGLWQWLRKLGG